MKTSINVLMVCILALFIIQCEVVSNDLLQDPNAPSPENVSPDFLLNNIQLSLGTNSIGGLGTPVPNGGLFNDMEDEGGEVTRMYHMFGTTYENAYVGQTFDTEWATAYAGILIDVKTLIPLAQERQLFTHEGIARIIRAYTLTMMVDNFGDVPFTEALDGTNFNPVTDPGQQVYTAALAELDSAIAALNKTELASPATDIYYGGNDEPWITLANTLKLKILYQQRLVNDNAPAINGLLNGDVIDEPGEEFIFRYSTNSNNPDSRHPRFSANYLTTGASDYMANNYMNMLWNDKEVADPRIRYYLYRQVDTPTTNVNNQQCINNAPPTHYAGNDGSGKNGNDPHCEDWNDVGYWGRDHGNSLGIPPDTFLRTTFGVYPIGGRFDADQATGVASTQGLQGAGIQPMWMPFFTDFVRAEVELTLNNDPAAARIALDNAMRNSFDYVMDFASGNNPTGTDAVALEDTTGIDDPVDNIEPYVQEVLARYDAGDTQAKLNVIAKEFYLALWGNGYEAYNLYRRIAPAQDAPNWDLQPHLQASPGMFMRSFDYPAAFVERNSSVEQKANNGVKIFWDNNRDGFGDF